MTAVPRSQVATERLGRRLKPGLGVLVGPVGSGPKPDLTPSLGQGDMATNSLKVAT